MKKYSRLNKFLHRIYLKNYFVSKSTLEYELDSLDNQIWDSIANFRNVCEQFYLEKETEND